MDRNDGAYIYSHKQRIIKSSKRVKETPNQEDNFYQRTCGHTHIQNSTSIGFNITKCMARRFIYFIANRLTHSCSQRGNLVDYIFCKLCVQCALLLLKQTKKDLHVFFPMRTLLFFLLFLRFLPRQSITFWYDFATERTNGPNVYRKRSNFRVEMLPICITIDNQRITHSTYKQIDSVCAKCSMMISVRFVGFSHSIRCKNGMEEDKIFYFICLTEFIRHSSSSLEIILSLLQCNIRKKK